MKLTTIGNLLTSFTCLTGSAFILLYHLRAEWWPRWNRMGQNLMAYGMVLVAVTFLSVVRWIGGASLDTYWFALLRLAVFALVPATILWRIVIMWSVTNWRWKPAPPAPPDLRDELLYEAWALIANVGTAGNGWSVDSGWREAAEKWRTRWHSTLSIPDIQENIDG